MPVGAGRWELARHLPPVGLPVRGLIPGGALQMLPSHQAPATTRQSPFQGTVSWPWFRGWVMNLSENPTNTIHLLGYNSLQHTRHRLGCPRTLCAPPKVLGTADPVRELLFQGECVVCILITNLIVSPPQTAPSLPLPNVQSLSLSAGFDKWKCNSFSESAPLSSLCVPFASQMAAGGSHTTRCKECHLQAPLQGPRRPPGL